MYTSVIHISNEEAILFHQHGEDVYVPYQVIQNQGFDAELKICKNKSQLTNALNTLVGTEKSKTLADDILWDIYCNSLHCTEPEWFKTFKTN